MQALVSSSGKAKFTEVVGGNPVLAEAAIDAVGKRKWEPTAQETKETIEVRFNPGK